MRAVARLITDAISRRDHPAVADRLRDEVAEIVARFPVPGLAAEGAD
jgi:glycine/serine hydroxymethyltransferase